MKKFFMLSCVSLVLIISSVKVNAADEDLHERVRTSSHYKLVEFTENQFSYLFINPYNLNDEESKEVEPIFIKHDLISPDSILTPTCAMDIRSELLEKMMKGNQHALDHDISIEPDERTRLKAEIEIMQKVLAGKK